MLSLYRFLVRAGTRSQIKHGEIGEDSKAAEVIKHEERGRKKGILCALQRMAQHI